MDTNEKGETNPILLEASSKTSVEEIAQTATTVKQGLNSAISQASECIQDLAKIKETGIENIERKVSAIGNALSVLALAKKEYCGLMFQPNSLAELKHIQKSFSKERKELGHVWEDDGEDD